MLGLLVCRVITGDGDRWIRGRRVEARGTKIYLLGAPQALHTHSPWSVTQQQKNHRLGAEPASSPPQAPGSRHRSLTFTWVIKAGQSHSCRSNATNGCIERRDRSRECIWCASMRQQPQVQLRIRRTHIGFWQYTRNDRHRLHRVTTSDVVVVFFERRKPC